MSVTTATGTVLPAPGTPPAGAPAVVSGTGRAARARARVQAGLSGSPGRLRIALTLAALAGFVFALLGGQAFLLRSSSLDQAQQDVQQLVRVQGIRTNLVQADAQATNAFLAGGLEPAASRAAYTAAIDAATRDIVLAARANPDDADQLAGVGRTVATYTGLIESARANNRQGFPLGNAYLGQASQLLRTDALPKLSEVVDNGQRRVSHGYNDRAGAAFLFAGAGIVVLIVLLGVQGWLARHTHRYFNVPLATATAAVVLSLLVGVIVMGAVQSQADNIRTGPYTAAVGLAQARVAGFDAKSAENLTLINRGSGQKNEADWKAAVAFAKRGLAIAGRTGVGADATKRFEDYSQVHTAIRKLDDGGQWDQAVARASSADADGGSGSFKAFADASNAALDQQEKQVVDGFTASFAALYVAGILALLAGLAAALLGGLGVLQRLEEYR